MTNNTNPRQRIRKKTTVYRGKGASVEFQNEEYSVFLNDGNIGTREIEEAPVIQGLVSHEPKEVAGQCQSCLNFATREMILICDCCWQVVCRPCAGKREKMKVCPACNRYLRRRRWFLILRKLFIEPFVEKRR